MRNAAACGYGVAVTQDLAPPQPLLVVVADDGGVDAARNRGIALAAARGVVRAVSVLAGAPATADLVARLRDLEPAARPEIGLHLCLTEGYALAGPAAGLTDAAGRFLGDKPGFWERALAGDVPAAAVQRETTAQLARLAELGLHVSSLDGHQHVHVLPGVREGVAAALRDASHVRWVRLGTPVVAAGSVPAAFPRLPAARVASRWRALHDAGRVAQAALGTLHDECACLLGGGRRAASAFAGADLLAASTCEALERELRAAAALAPGGVIELMTHPGDCARDSVRFSAQPSRSAERDQLCGDDLPRILRDLGIRLGRFSDADVEESA